MKMDTPGIYRIKVQGKLEADWADRVGGLEVTAINVNSGIEETTLEGRLEDQAALTGLLVALYELHLPLKLVECLEENVK